MENVLIRTAIGACDATNSHDLSQISITPWVGKAELMKVEAANNGYVLKPTGEHVKVMNVNLEAHDAPPEGHAWLAKALKDQNGTYVLFSVGKKPLGPGK